MEVLLINIQSFSESSFLAKYGIIATALGAVLCIYGLSLVIYRLYFDHLAGFPGPRIAAATGWYEFYHDVIRRGQYIYKIEEMHKKYGIVNYFLHPFRCGKTYMATVADIDQYSFQRFTVFKSPKKISRRPAVLALSISNSSSPKFRR